MAKPEQLGLFDDALARREEARRGKEWREEQARQHHERAHRTGLEWGVRDYGLVLCPDCGGDEHRACWTSQPCPRCAGHWWLWPDGRQLTATQFWGVLGLKEPEVVRAGAPLL